MEKEKLPYLQIHPKDNVLVALRNLPQGLQLQFEGHEITLLEAVEAKHKFTIGPLAKDAEVLMYGVLVGKMNEDVPAGTRLSVHNLRHAADDFKLGTRKIDWQKPDVSLYERRKFMGFERSNGSVGTANHWLVIPLVFCENRNVLTLKKAFSISSCSVPSSCCSKTYRGLSKLGSRFRICSFKMEACAC